MTVQFRGVFHRQPDFGWLKAKFHYASWLGAGSELVRSWFEPDSVMEFGFNCDVLQLTSNKLVD